MIKTYCDICGKDITEEGYSTLTIDYVERNEPSPKGPDEFDICTDCKNELIYQIFKKQEAITNDR